MIKLLQDKDFDIIRIITVKFTEICFLIDIEISAYINMNYKVWITNLYDFIFFRNNFSLKKWFAFLSFVKLE